MDLCGELSLLEREEVELLDIFGDETSNIIARNLSHLCSLFQKERCK
jgi:hypothetical protein